MAMTEKELLVLMHKQRDTERWVREIPADSPWKGFGEDSARLSREMLNEVIESVERIKRLDEQE
jgi:hypothetical protein